jgi:predicted PurR-regulated permease PerM
VVVLYLARDIVAPFVVAATFAYIFSPIVNRIAERFKLPRRLVAVVLYLALLGLLGLGIWLLGARLAHEARLLSTAGPDLVDAAVIRLLGKEPFPMFGQHVDPHMVAQWINGRVADTLEAPSDALNALERAFEFILKTFLMLVAFLYLLLDGHRVGRYVSKFIPGSRRPRVQQVAHHVDVVLGRYVRGQLFLVVLMSVVTYIVLTQLFHLHYALPLALLTGVLEVIPFIGPVGAAAAAAMVALVQGGTQTMIWVIVAYTVLRQAEDQLIMPIVVGHAVHLHPLVTIFAVLTGAATAGVLGALLAVPIAAVLRIVLDELVVGSNHAEAALVTMEPALETPPSSASSPASAHPPVEPLSTANTPNLPIR